MDYVVNNTASNAVFTAITCISPDDCLAVGLGGVVVFGPKSASVPWSSVVIDAGLLPLSHHLSIIMLS
jgi:hypothetical protein